MRLVINIAANKKYCNEVKERKRKYDEQYLSELKKLEDARTEAINNAIKREGERKKNRNNKLLQDKGIDISAANITRKNPIVINDEAARLFPLPRPVIKIEQDDPQADNAPQADNDPQAADNSIFTFRKVHADAIHFLRTNVRTLFGFEKKNSQKYDAMKEALESLQTNYPNGMVFTKAEDDLDTLRNKATLYRAALKRVQEATNKYLKKVGDSQATKSGQERCRNAKLVQEMIAAKINAFDAQMEQLVAQFTTAKNNRADYIQTQNTLDQTAYNAVVQEIEHTYENNLIQSDQQERDALTNANNAADKSYQDALEKLNEDIAAKTTVSSFSDLDDEQKQLFIQAKLADKLFDKKHNPFSDYRSEVAEGQRSYDNILDLDRRKNAIELDALKEMVNPPGSAKKIPITYTPDALITLSNLRLMDKIMGQERDKNAYQVNYVILDKKGRPLSKTEREKLDFRKVSEEGYKCLVTTINADPIPSPGGLQSLDKASDFHMDEDGIIDKDTTLSLIRFDKTLSLTEPEFDEAIPGGGTVKDLLDSRIRKVQDVLQNRMKVDTSNRISIDSDKQFNFTSVKQLKKRIAEKAIDYRPIRPSKQLAKKVYIKPGIVRNAGNYYDEELISNLETNIKETNNKALDFAQTNADLDAKIFRAEKLVLSDKALISDALQASFERARENKDESLIRIENMMKEMQSLGKESVFTFEENELDEFVISDFECEYDKRAGELYGLVKKYLKDHKGDLADPNSAATALQNWKNQVGFDGPDTIPFSDGTDVPEDIKIESDDEYLFQANLFAYDTDYISSDDPEEKKKLVHLGFDTKNPQVRILDVSDKPLFPRKPSLSDIKQGHVGDCYFLSVLASMAADHPEEIEHMIKDNGDTVTCRFYNKSRQPVLVTVPKTLAVVESTIPEVKEKTMPSIVTGETGPLWFHLMEKAFMLSGIREEYIDLDSKRGAEMLNKAREKNNLPESEPAENIKLKILKDCYPEEFKDFTYANAPDEKAQQIEEVNRRIKTLFAKSCFGISGGEMTEAMTALTGTVAMAINLKATSGSHVISTLSNITRGGICAFAGDKFEFLNPVPTDDTDPDLDEKKESAKMEINTLRAICRIAARKLSLDKVDFGTDINGVKFQTVQSVSLEELVNALNAAVDDDDPLFKAEFYKQTEEGPALKYGLESLDEITEFKNNFVKGLQTNQKYNTSPDIKLYSEKPGNYSNTAKDIKKMIIENYDKKKLLNCSFQGATVRNTDSASKIDEDDLLISTAISTEEDKGVYKQHAYTITGYREDENGHFYVFIRNPWGSGGAKETSTDVFLGRADKTITYTAASFDEDDLKNGTAGTFEMELNQFMSITKDIHIGEVRKYSKSEVANALAGEMLNNLKKTNPKQYDRKIPTENAKGKAIKQLSGSASIQKAADKYIQSSATKELMDAGVKLPAERVHEMHEQIKDIKATLSLHAPKKELTKDMVKNTQPEVKGLI